MRINEILLEDSGESPVVEFDELVSVMKTKHKIDLYDVYRNGRNPKMPYYNFWHFIMNVAREDERAATVLISPDLIPAEQTFSEQKRAEIFKRFADDAIAAGDQPTDEMYNTISQMIMSKEASAKGTKKIVDLVLDHYLGPITIKTGY